MATRTPIACLAPGPIGTAWRRTSSGELTTRTSGWSRRSSSAFQVPCSSSVSPAASTVSLGTQVLAVALHGQDDEIAARGDHAREYGLPDKARARRDHDLGEAGAAVEQGVGDVGRPNPPTRNARRWSAASRATACASPRTMSISPSASVGRCSGPPASPACDRHQGQARIAGEMAVRAAARRNRASPSGRAAGTARRPACSARSACARACSGRPGCVRPLRSGSSRGPSSTMIAMVPSSSGRPTQRELEIAERRLAGIRRRHPTPARSPACRSAPAGSRRGPRTPAASAAATAGGRGGPP